MKTFEIGGIQVIQVPAEGPPLGSERDATDLMGEAHGVERALFAIPVERLSPDFLKLRTRMAGLFIQKFVNYGVRVAFVGDITAEVAGSPALAAFVAESNRGAAVWFVSDGGVEATARGVTRLRPPWRQRDRPTAPRPCLPARGRNPQTSG